MAFVKPKKINCNSWWNTVRYFSSFKVLYCEIFWWIDSWMRSDAFLSHIEIMECLEVLSWLSGQRMASAYSSFGVRISLDFIAERRSWRTLNQKKEWCWVKWSKRVHQGTVKEIAQTWTHQSQKFIIFQLEAWTRIVGVIGTIVPFSRELGFVRANKRLARASKRLARASS